MANGHYVYIVMCSDNTLYTGYTVDVDKRMIAHNNGTGAKYTRARLPVELKYIEMFDSKSDAMKREYEIKQLTRSEKFKLMEVME
ncbi:MAG TPA: GIY-YIG nuclease family protein [Jeotgalicoccus sp.]|nr:GIY-YIG nuclease family protein [Jeotgalicoccus sp.]